MSVLAVGTLTSSRYREVDVSFRKTSSGVWRPTPALVNAKGIGDVIICHATSTESYAHSTGLEV